MEEVVDLVWGAVSTFGAWLIATKTAGLWILCNLLELFVVLLEILLGLHHSSVMVGLELWERAREWTVEPLTRRLDQWWLGKVRATMSPE